MSYITKSQHCNDEDNTIQIMSVTFHSVGIKA